MNPRSTYTTSLTTPSSAWQGAMSGYEIGPDGKLRKKQANKTSSSNVTWGIPQGTSNFPMPSMNTANSTPAVSSNVAKNPTAGTMTPSSPGATSLTTGSNAPSSSSITSPTSSSLSPAGQSYASQLAEIMKGAQNLQTTFDSYKANQNKTSTTDDSKNNESEYLKYLRSMFNPEEARRAQENINSLNKQTADEIARSKKEQDRIQKNEAGIVERGQTYLSTGEARASAETLANLAISKGYNTDILNQYLDAGKSLYEAEQAAEAESKSTLSLEEAQALGLPFGTTLGEARKMGIVPTGGSGNLNDATVFAYADMISSGQMKIENVPEDYRGAVAQAVGLAGPQNTMSDYQKERITRNLNSIEDLMGQVSGWNTGMGSLIAAIPGTPAANFRADVNTLAANIAFGELTAMREASKTGGALGQVSERELALLEAALGSLDRAQSPDQFKKSLQNIKESIERWQSAVDQYGGGTTSTGGGDESGLYDF